MVTALRSLWGRFLDRLLAPVFGDDIFISYSRSDGTTYAVALASRLADENFACKIDVYGTRPNETVPRALLDSLRRSALLVLVATPGAARSVNVATEVNEFLKSGNKAIVPVVFDGVSLKQGCILSGKLLKSSSGALQSEMETALFAEGIVGLPLQIEDSGRLASGEVSSETLNRIRNTFTFQKKDARLKKATGVLLVLLFALASASVVAGRLASNRAGMVAKAEIELRKTEAARSRAATGSLSAAAEWITASSSNSTALRRAVIGTIDAYARLNPLPREIPAKLHAVLTEANILSRQFGSRLGLGAYSRIHSLAMSPNGALVVAAVNIKSGQAKERHAVVVANVLTGEIIDEIPSEVEVRACALSRDQTSLAIGDANGVVTFLTRVDGSWVRKWSSSLPSIIASIGFAAGERRLIALADRDDRSGVSLFYLEAATGLPTQINLAKSVRAFVTQTRAGFDLLENWPAVIATWETRADSGPVLTVIRTDTDARAEYDLGQESLDRWTGGSGISPFSSPIIDSTGRWLAIPRAENDTLQEKSYLVDLVCVADSARHCTPIHALAADEVGSAAVEGGFSPDGKYLVLKGKQQRVQVWETRAVTEGNAQPAILEVENGSPHFKGFTGDESMLLLVQHVGQQIQTDGERAELQEWNFAKRKLIRGHAVSFGFVHQINPRTTKVRVAVDGAFYVTSTRSGSGAFISEARSAGGSVLFDHDQSLGPVIDVTAPPGGYVGATIHEGGEVAVWDLSVPRLDGVVSGFRGGVGASVWAQLGGRPILYAASHDGQVLRWEEPNRVVSLRPPPTLKGVFELQVASDGSVLAASGSEVLALWKENRWREVTLSSQPVTALSKDGRSYAVANEDGSVHVFDLDGTHRATLEPALVPMKPSRISFAASDSRVVGETLIAITAEVVIWDVRGGPPLTDGSRRPSANDLVSGVAADPSRRWALQTDGETILIDVLTGGRLASVPGNPMQEGLGATGLTVSSYSSAVGLGAAASPARRYSPSNNAGHSVAQVWDLESGESQAFIPISTKSRRLNFVLDGRAMLLLSPDGTPTLVPLSFDQKLKGLCSFVYTDIELTQLQRSPGAFEFCYSVFERQRNGTSPLTSPWRRQAPPH